MFIHSSPNLAITMNSAAGIAYLYLVLSLRFSLVPPFGTYSSISSFYLILCTYFSLLGRLVQFSSVAQSYLTLWNPIDCSIPGLPVCINSRSLLNLMSIELVMPSNHLILCHPLLLLLSIFPRVTDFSTESFLCIRWPKFWSFRSVLPTNIQDWFPLGLTGWVSLLSKEISKVFVNTTVQKHRFFGTYLSL